MAQITYTPLGDYFFTVDLLDPGGDLNSDGSQPNTSVFATSVPAAISPLSVTSQSEVTKAQQVLPEVAYKVVIRYMPGVLERMKVVYTQPDNGPKTWDIMRIVDPDLKRVELWLMCSEKNAGQG